MNVVVKWYCYIHKGPLLNGANPVCGKDIGTRASTRKVGSESVNDRIKLRPSALVNSPEVYQ